MDGLEAISRSNTRFNVLDILVVIVPSLKLPLVLVNVQLRTLEECCPSWLTSRIISWR